MTKDQSARYAAFFAATKGHTADDVALALSEQVCGIDWHGSTKHLMADTYATVPYGTEHALRTVDLVALKASLDEKKRQKERARAEREASKPKLPDDPARLWSIEIARRLVDSRKSRLGLGWAYLSPRVQSALIDSDVLALVCDHHADTVSRDAVFCLRRDAQIIAGLWEINDETV